MRVKGARYFSPAQIKRMVPSLGEGRVPNFKEAEKEIVRLNLPNRFAGRRVLPELKAGREPDTFEVEDASASLNPRAEHDTDLAAPWTPAVDGVGGVTITVENDAFAAGVDRVTVRIPSGGPNHFARLAVSP